jgi:hypothetical protein
MFWIDQQSDAFFETLKPIELIKLSIMDNWLFNDGMLTAHCPEGHWYSAKADQMDEGCLICEASKDPGYRDDLEPRTFTRSPRKGSMGFLMKAETPVAKPVRQLYDAQGEVGYGSVTTNTDDYELLERSDAEMLFSEAVCDTLLTQLKKAEGFDLVQGLHAFEFKKQDDMSDVQLMQSFVAAFTDKCRHWGLRPPQLSDEYFEWAKKRGANLQSPKLSWPDKTD